jgi:8-oxo-dGTP pyrophosphatase MutT (NUDIX family)
MNTRIYYQDKCLEFTPAGRPGEDTVPQNSLNQSVVIYRSDDQKQLSPGKLAKIFCDPDDGKNILLVGFDPEATIDSLKAHFHYIEAAGGLIRQNGKWLFIRRHDRWDLPKGKLEKKESPRLGAIRECEEECGVRDLKITGELRPTYHVYPHKGGFALKRSHWFLMETDFRGKLHPQLEEHITEVRWFSPDEVRSTVLEDTYYTIADVIQEGIPS